LKTINNPLNYIKKVVGRLILNAYKKLCLTFQHLLDNMVITVEFFFMPDHRLLPNYTKSTNDLQAVHCLIYKLTVYR
jgi:hypothetical protein